MAVTPRKMTSAQVAATATTYYTCPVSTKAKIQKLAFCNSTANARLITVYRVPAAGTAGVTNILVSAQPIAAGETWECFEAEGQVLEAADFLQCLCDSASAVTLQGSVVEFV